MDRNGKAEAVVIGTLMLVPRGAVSSLRIAGLQFGCREQWKHTMLNRNLFR